MDANAPAPQALSLRVAFDGAVDDASVRRTTAAQPIFEVSRNTGDAIAYLVAFNDNAPLTLDASRSAVIAEIEVSAPGAVRLTIDPQLTMLIAPGMEQKASVANRNLRVSGTVLNRVAPTLNRDGE